MAAELVSRHPKPQPIDSIDDSMTIRACHHHERATVSRVREPPAALGVTDPPTADSAASPACWPPTI